MQRMQQKDQRLSSSRQTFYYPPTKPRQAHYPITIQVSRRDRWCIGEKLLKHIQDTNIDKKYGFLVAILLLFCGLGTVVAGGNASSSAQVSIKAQSTATRVVRIVRPHWKAFSPTAVPAPKASTMHASTSPAGPSSVSSSQPFITFTAAYATHRVLGVVSVHTLPRATLTISITYCRGQHATSPALRGASYANSNGDYIWTWKPKVSCTGLATARVTASIHGQAVSQTHVFRVG